MTDSPASGFQYQIDFTRFSPEEEILSFSSPSEPRLLDALKRLNTFFTTSAPERFFKLDKPEVKTKLPPNEPTMLVNLPGPGAIDYFEIQIADATMTTMNNVVLEMYWDGMDTPSVQCNLRQFFCNIDFSSNWNSLPMGYIQKANLLYCQFYMPFQKKAQIFLTNLNEKSLDVVVRYHVTIDARKIEDNPLNLFVRSNQRTLYTGLSYPLLEFEGNGNFMGINLIGYTESKNRKFFFLEGDEYVFLNGEPNPTLKGTGMDNYFNIDNRSDKTNYFWTPFHGCLAILDQQTEKDQILQTGCNLYRFRSLDAIPFQSSIFSIQEIGCPIQFIENQDDPENQTLLNWTCYWYGKPSPTTVNRKEQAFYFKISDKENDIPTLDSPIMFGEKLHVQLPKGTWWVHYAPIWNINDIQHIKQEIQ